MFFIVKKLFIKQFALLICYYKNLTLLEKTKVQLKKTQLKYEVLILGKRQYFKPYTCDEKRPQK
jgi:hypothetical protein